MSYMFFSIKTISLIVGPPITIASQIATHDYFAKAQPCHSVQICHIHPPEVTFSVDFPLQSA